MALDRKVVVTFHLDVEVRLCANTEAQAVRDGIRMACVQLGLINGFGDPVYSAQDDKTILSVKVDPEGDYDPDTFLRPARHCEACGSKMVQLGWCEVCGSELIVEDD